MNAELTQAEDNAYVAPALSPRRSLGPRLQHRADEVNDLRREPFYKENMYIQQGQQVCS